MPGTHCPHRLFLLWLLSSPVAELSIYVISLSFVPEADIHRTKYNQCKRKDSTETKKKTRHTLVAITLFCKPTATASHGNHHVGQPLRCIIDEFGRYVIIRFEFLAL